VPSQSSKPNRFAGAMSLSVTLVLVGLIAPLPATLRLLVLLGVALAWFMAASRWCIHRFGRKYLVAIAVVGLSSLGLLARAYWLDQPNRRLLDEIEQIPGCVATNTHGLVVGKIDHVYISSKANASDVSRFADLAGLDDLKILFVDGVPLNDATAKKIGRLKSLRHLCLSESGITEEVAEHLCQDLPDCSIEIR
jgi:hypothetical protein